MKSNLPDRIIFLAPTLTALNATSYHPAKALFKSSSSSYRESSDLKRSKRLWDSEKETSADRHQLSASRPSKKQALHHAKHSEIEYDAPEDHNNHIGTSVQQSHASADQQSDKQPQQSRHASTYNDDSESDGDKIDEDGSYPERLRNLKDYEDVGPAINPISKAERLRLGPARVVGMRRTVTKKPPLLKALERPKADEEHSRTGESLARVSPRSLDDTESYDLDAGSIGGITTVESIPPPPTHAFSLSHITSISTLLSSPNRFLSSFQGGSQHEVALKFNLLAIVMRVGGLEDAPDWKTGGKRSMDRCEIVVKDISDCTIKVILESNCATLWATPKEGHSMDNDQTSLLESLADESQLSDIDSNRYSNIINTRVSAMSQDDSTSASRTTIERQKNDQLLPIRPGDVVVLYRLTLVRPRPSKQQRSSLRLSDPKVWSSHAVASPSSASQVELCWRNDIQRKEDQRRNFDKCLTAFDARCKAIHRLAQTWTPSN